MDVVIVKKSGQARAYSADLLAGVSGLGSGAEFAAAVRSDGALLDAATKGVEPFDEAQGLGGAQVLRKRLQSSGHSVVYDSVSELHGGELERTVVRGQTSALTQMAQVSGIKQALTRRAVAAAATLALIMTGVAVPMTAHAENGVRRVVVDTIFGAAGAAAGNRIGQGKGKQLATVVGGGLGVLLGESVNRGMDEREAARQQAQQQYGRGAQINSDGVWTGGTRQLEPDRADAMRGLADMSAQQRSRYASAIYHANQAAIDRTLRRGDPNAAAAEGQANAQVNATQRNYSDTRADFMRAYEMLGRNGYDMSPYVNEYLACQRQVNVADVAASDVRRMQQAPGARYDGVSNSMSY